MKILRKKKKRQIEVTLSSLMDDQNLIQINIFLFVINDNFFIVTLSRINLSFSGILVSSYLFHFVVVFKLMMEKRTFESSS